MICMYQYIILKAPLGVRFCFKNKSKCINCISEEK